MRNIRACQFPLLRQMLKPTLMAALQCRQDFGVPGYDNATADRGVVLWFRRNQLKRD